MIIIIVTLSSSGAGQTLPLLLLCLHAGGDGGGARRGAPHHRLLILYRGHCFSLDYCDLSLVNFFPLAPPWPLSATEAHGPTHNDIPCVRGVEKWR